MNPSLKRFRLLALGVVAAVALVACGEGSGGTPGAATVNGTMISQPELDRAIPEFRFLSTLSQQPCGTPTQGESSGSACARFTLANLVQGQIITDYATENNVTLPPGKVTKTIGDLEKQMGGAAKLDKLLKDNNLTRPGLEALAGRLLLFQQVQSVIADKGVSEADIRKAYEQQKASLTTIRAKQVLLKDKKSAQKIADQATKANFSSLAKKYSTDRGSAKNGGDLGQIPASQLDPAFAEAALALKPGEISKPVQTKFGWHVILLVNANQPSLSDVRDQLSQQLAATSFTTWFQQQLNDADVSVNPRYGTFDPKTGAINPIRSTSTGGATGATGATGAGPVNGSPGAGTATGATGGAGPAGATGASPAP